MGNKNSRVGTPLYAKPSPTYARPSSYGRPSGSLYSASGVSRTGNPNYSAPSPAERGMLYCKIKNTTPAPTPTALYGKKTKSKAVSTPTTLYSKPSAASTPKPTPTALYSKKSKGSRGFSRSSTSRSGVSLSGASIGQPSPYAMSGVSANSACSRSTVANKALAQMPMTSCVKCRMPFGDSTAAFCRDCGHPRPERTITTAQRVSDERNSFGKHGVAF